MNKTRKFYKEDYALSVILNDYKPFSDFYNIERPKITKDVLWVIPEEEIAAEMLFGVIGDDECFLIAAKHFPVPVTQAFSAAHELQHLICRQEGYPSLTYFDMENWGRCYINMHISDMINDPIVNARIVDYGFDLDEYINRTISVTKNSVGINNQNPEDLILLEVVYVKIHLYYEILKNKGIQKKNEYNEWFEQNYLGLLPRAEKLLNMIIKTGYDTPDKTVHVLRRAIRIYNLQDVLKIVY